jgi:hypothetical protein
MGKWQEENKKNFTTKNTKSLTQKTQEAQGVQTFKYFDGIPLMDRLTGLTPWGQARYRFTTPEQVRGRFQTEGA